MMRYHDYDVRVWQDGDVDIHHRARLAFMQMGGRSGIQSNATDPEMQRALHGACADVANAMRALESVLDEIERRQDVEEH